MLLHVQYGGQLVPISAEEERMLKYTSSYGGREGGKGLWLLGFVDRELVPRHHYMKVGI
jgi:hypothetical protein